MARKIQDGEKMVACGVRLSPQLLDRIDAYGASLKAQNPGLRIERGDAMRTLLLKGLDLVEAAGTGQVLAAGQDLSPTGADQSLHKAARERTTVRQGRKRPAAAKG